MCVCVCVCVCVPGLEGEVVCEVGLYVEQGLLLSLSVDELALLQAQTALLHVDDHRVRQVAPHDKQRTKHHLLNTHTQ